MSFAHRHLESAGKIITEYDGSVPLHHFLKQFFAADRKYGSKDRKAISHACYCFYRLGHSLKDMPVPERMKAGIFLCSAEPGNWKGLYDQNWLTAWSGEIRERVAFCTQRIGFDLREVFPFQAHLGEGMDADPFCLSHLVQPEFYIRIRPGREQKVLESLRAAGVPFRPAGETGLSLPQGTAIEKLVSKDEDVVVQDISSQRLGSIIEKIHAGNRPVRVWDCCAASGGKSILAADCLPEIDLTVSDVRPSIINNLRNRLASAGIRHYRSFVADLTKGGPLKQKFDLVICDAPCSGSGTWSRNPEQLRFFTDGKIDQYATLQKLIITHTAGSVDTHGHLLYVTCSVFREENEDAVQFILSNTRLRLVHQELITGYEEKADSMFAALFTASPL